MSENDTHAADQVSAVKHASPMLRSAKVVCQSGEYICLVRDVSDEGVLLSFLHDVPSEPRIILALGNGRTYPIQRIWSGKEQAGYRFAGAVTLAEFLHESAPFNLRPVRLSVRATARIIDGAQSHVARLLDISTHGAKIECNAPMAQGRLISCQMHGVAQQLSQVVWCEATETGAVCGLQFQHPLTLRELARSALRMQPDGPQGLSGPERTFSQPLAKATAA